MPEADNADTARLLRLNGTIVISLSGSASEEPGRDLDTDVVEEVINTFLAEFADALRPLIMSELKFQSSFGNGAPVVASSQRPRQCSPRP